MKKLLTTLACVFSFAILSADLTGVYHAFGHNPDGTQYSANLIIQRTGETFTLNWRFADGSEDIGTGVRDNGFLAVTFRNETTLLGQGVQLYEIHHHDGCEELKGPWAFLGDTRTGSERANKVSES